MEGLVSIGFKVLWCFLALFWLWSARHVKRTSRTEPMLLQIAAYWVPLIIAFVLLGSGDWFQGSILKERFAPKEPWIKWLGFALAASGVFAQDS